MSVIDSTIALLTVEELQRYRGEAVDNDEADEQRLGLIINSISQQIENYCGRKFITPGAALSEIFNGDGEKDYIVKNMRMTATPTISYWSSTTWTVTSGTFTYTGDTGRVYFTDGNTFWRGEDNWKIEYLYGWTQATIPNEIKMAAALMCIRSMLALKKTGRSSESFGDSTTAYDFGTMPVEIRSALEKYRRPGIG